MSTMKKEEGAHSGGVWWWVASLLNPLTACLLPTSLPMHWIPRLRLMTFARAALPFVQLSPPFSQFSAQVPSPLRRPSSPWHPKSHPSTLYPLTLLCVSSWCLLQCIRFVLVYWFVSSPPALEQKHQELRDFVQICHFFSPPPSIYSFQVLSCCCCSWRWR